MQRWLIAAASHELTCVTISWSQVSAVEKLRKRWKTTFFEKLESEAVSNRENFHHLGIGRMLRGFTVHGLKQT